MSDFRSSNRPRGAERPEVANVTEARQGVTGHNVRYVLGTALFLLLIAGIVLYFTVGR